MFESITENTIWPALLQESAIKSLVLLSVTFLFTLALRRAAAATRHLIWTFALSGVILLPIFSLLLPAWQVPVLPGKSPTEAEALNPMAAIESESSGVVSQSAPYMPAPNQTAATVGNPWRFISFWSWSGWIFAAWLTGMLIILGRYGIGLTRIWYITRRAQPVTGDTILSKRDRVCDRLELAGRIPLFRSNRITMPLTWGIFRPIVLLPEASDTWTDDRLEVVLTHELAHVKRRDCLSQLLAQVACALHWFNPLIWVATRQQRMERERACDDQVLHSGARASRYADHLLDMARAFRTEQPGSFATVAFARRSQLEGRLLAILDPHVRRRGATRLVALCLGVGISLTVIPLATIQPVAQTRPLVIPPMVVPPPDTTQAPLAATAPIAPPSIEVDSPPEVPIASVTDAVEVVDSILGVVEALETTGAVMDVVEATVEVANVLNAVAASEFDMDQEGERGIETEDYLMELAVAGYDNLSIDELIALKTHGISAAYIKQLQALGYEALTIDQIVALKIHGVNAAYIGQMKAALDRHIPYSKLLGARIQGVTPEFIRDLRTAFGNDLTLGKIVSFRIHGVTSAFVESAWHRFGDDLTADELIGMRIHGITIAFADDIDRLGFHDVSISELQTMRIHNVTEQFIRDIRDLGYEDLEIRDFVSFRIHGVSPDFIRRAHERGFDDLDVDQLIALKRTGIIR